MPVSFECKLLVDGRKRGQLFSPWESLQYQFCLQSNKTSFGETSQTKPKITGNSINPDPIVRFKDNSNQLNDGECK
jgi:hypothetical protein